MRSACLALLLVFPLVVPVRAGCGPSDPRAQAARDVEAIAAEIARVKEALATEKQERAREEELSRRKIAALEQELASSRKTRDDRINQLTAQLDALESRAAQLKASPAGKTPSPAENPGPDKLDLILKKLDDLDNRMRKLEGRSAGSRDNGGDPYISKVRTITLPLRVDPVRRDAVRELVLFVSTDEGKTWTEVARSTPDRESFSFTAPSDGLYWLSVQVVSKDGRKDPADVATQPPGFKVRFDTGRN